MKIAKFKSIEHGFESIDSESIEKLNGYVRMTKYVDVEFLSLERNFIAEKEANILNDVKKKIQADAQVKLNEIDRRISELLALPQPE